jgi:putative tryptophan/tyrosine transport system substrate-binding protein
MRRREFIAGLGGALAWSVTARAQQPDRMRRIGSLSAGEKSGPGADRHNAFKRGLAELGWIEGRNLVFEERWSNFDPEHLRSNAAELTALRPDLIFAVTSAALSEMRRATETIPIVFSVVTDPVGQGFVSSLARPGGNITGFATAEFAYGTKSLDLLKNMVPSLKRVAVVYDAQQPTASGVFEEVEAVSTVLGVEVSKTPVRSPDDIDRTISTLAHASEGGLFVIAGSATVRHRELIIALAAQYRLPAIYSIRYYVSSGGLASYGTDDVDLCRRAASYADRILKGEKPADLPVQLPTTFRFALNLKTAKAMGLVIPASVLALADEVIE